MIGKIGTGKSFRGCLKYLYEGRHQENEILQLEEMAKKQAEVIGYNQCFGTKKELIRQFIEVSKLNPNVSKPVFHASLSLAHNDSGQLGVQDKVDIAAGLAKKFGFENNQYVVITHSDTGHEHLHVVANRIDYDGKTASDSNSYKRMAEFCRSIEKAYGLTAVLSPGRFLSPTERKGQVQRTDKRKELLKETLEWAISKSTNSKEVKGFMERQGYVVEIARGIAFTDQEMVRFKGSQVGYSLADIERKLITQNIQEPVLPLPQRLRQDMEQKKNEQKELAKVDQQQEQENSHKYSRGFSR
jgi:hypothetical protein